MRYKILGGRTGLKVAEFALGTGMLGMQYGYGTEPEEARRIVGGYIEAGGNLFDLSDAYQGGESEKLIGDFIATNRNDYVIATKYSRSSHSKPSLGVLGNSRKVMIQAVEESLKRLKTDHIDIYFAHLDDGVTPMEEIARGFDDLARAGKILYAGLSNFPAWRVATAAKTADLRGWVPISAVEVEYSLLQRSTEREILPMADALGLGVLGYSTLAGGILTAKYRKGEKGRATDFKASVPYLAYAVAFFNVGVIWCNHHYLFGHLCNVDLAMKAASLAFYGIIQHLRVISMEGINALANHPHLGQQTHQHRNGGSAKISNADAFVFVIREYDGGFKGQLIAPRVVTKGTPRETLDPARRTYKAIMPAALSWISSAGSSIAIIRP
jgi:aryl-alcohol dehydrogenase-like predicted oxidoreductase